MAGGLEMAAARHWQSSHSRWVGGGGWLLDTEWQHPSPDVGPCHLLHNSCTSVCNASSALAQDPQPGIC
jgi:hypothetical protein